MKNIEPLIKGIIHIEKDYCTRAVLHHFVTTDSERVSVEIITEGVLTEFINNISLI